MDRWRDVAKHGFSLKGTSTGTAKLPTFSPQESAVDNTSPNQDDNAADREYNGISRALSLKFSYRFTSLGKLNYVVVLSFFNPKLNSIQTLVWPVLMCTMLQVHVSQAQQPHY